MRTTLNLPIELLEGVRKKLGFTSKTDTVIFALQELKRKNELKELVDAFGSLDINLNIDSIRERPVNNKPRSRKS